MKVHHPILYTYTGKRKTKFSEVLLTEEQSQQLFHIGWRVIASQLGMKSGYWLFSTEPSFPALSLLFPSLSEKKTEIHLKPGQKVIAAFPNGDTLLLTCFKQKPWAIHYTKNKVSRTHSGITEWDQVLLATLQGIVAFYELNKSLPENWEEIKVARANVWTLPTSFQEIFGSLFEISREGDLLSLTYFPRTENEFILHIQIVGKEKPERRTNEVDRRTDAALFTLQTIVHLLGYYFVELSTPPSGTSIRQWAEKLTPVNPSSFLWEHLASDTILTGIEARKVKRTLKLGQVLLYREGNLFHFEGFYLEPHPGIGVKPGPSGFTLGFQKIR